MIDIEKMSNTEILELESAINERIQGQALKSFDEILEFIRRSSNKEVILDIQSAEELTKMVEFINITDNQSEKDEIVKILNMLGYDIRPYFMRYNYHIFDGQPDSEKIKNKYSDCEPLKTEDVYELLLPYKYHTELDKEIFKESQFGKWLKTPVKVTVLTEVQQGVRKKRMKG